jgi:hypothetical protein
MRRINTICNGGSFIQSIELKNRINFDKRDIPIEIIENTVKLNDKFEIELKISINCDNHWIKIFNDDYLKMIKLERIRNPKIGSFLDKEYIVFKALKTGKTKLILVENSSLGPYKEIVYHIDIIN